MDANFVINVDRIGLNMINLGVKDLIIGFDLFKLKLFYSKYLMGSLLQIYLNFLKY